MRRIVTAIMLTLLLVSTLVSAFTILPVRAEGTIYIKADGSIDPPTAPISTADNVTYILTDNITSTSDGIVIERSNMTLAGAGYTVKGDGSPQYRGVKVFYQENVTIENVTVAAFTFGISLWSSNKSNLASNNLVENVYYDITIMGMNNKVSNNQITTNSFCAIDLHAWGSDNYVSENIMNGAGITVGGPRNIVCGNKMLDGGISLADPTGSYNNITENSLVNGSMWVGGSNNDITSNNITTKTTADYGIALQFCTNNSIIGNRITNGSRGISLYSSNNTRLICNNVTANEGIGIYIESALDTTVSRNNVTNNKDYGIYLANSNFTIVSENTLEKNSNHAIFIAISSHNTIKNNVISKNERGGIIFTLSSDYNIIANNSVSENVFSEWTGIGGGYGSKYNIIQQNQIWNHLEGIHIDWNDYYDPAPGNIIINNSISFCREGIYLNRANNVTVVNNTCISNEVGMKLHSADFNKIINNTITCPNMHNTQIGIFLSMSYAPVNHTCGNNIFVGNLIENYGVGVHIEDADHCDNNSIYHNSFINYDIAVENYGSMNFWDDGYPSGGNYWSDFNPPDIFSGPYRNETGSDKLGDTPYIIDANNTDSYPLIYPYGYVPSPDFNNDGIIDIFDIVRMALAYGSMPGMPNWDPYVDLNQDGLIDIFDLVVVALRFGETV